jgi:hypothetical protein
MRALAESGVPIFTFQPIKSDLEGAFWDLASAPTPTTQGEAPMRRAA